MGEGKPGQPVASAVSTARAPADSVPAVVLAGDRGSAKAVAGRSKCYLELGGRLLVAHVVAVLQQVPEVSAVWVVGDPEHLERALAPLEPELRKPLHILEQGRNLYENAWESYRHLLPGAGPEGRDPQSDADRDQPVLYVSGDLPFATPQEIAAFVREGLATGADYAIGFVEERDVAHFYPRHPGEPGIHPAYFNISEGRVRQSNLHLVRPARIENRHYIQEMYDHRYQKQFGNMVKLGWEILTSQRGGLRTAFYYGLLHLASLLDRWGWRRTSDRIRSWVPTVKVEHTVSQLLGASFRLVVTRCGGCAIDIDLDSEYEAARARYDEWLETQRERAERLYGSLSLPPAAAARDAGSGG